LEEKEMLNSVTIMGRLTHELEMKTTGNGGHAVVSFSIATKRNYKLNDEYPTDFFNVVAWRNTAEFICKHFGKGQQIIIEGALETRKFTDKNNVVRDVVEIIASKAHFCEKKPDNGTNGNGGYPAPPQNGNGNYTPQQNSYNAGVSYTPVPGMVSQNDGEFNSAPPDDFYPEFNN
jgi:single-strand DNA-binding protein